MHAAMMCCLPKCASHTIWIYCHMDANKNSTNLAFKQIFGNWFLIFSALPKIPLVINIPF